MSQRLFFGNVEMGEVMENDSDFLNNFGTFRRVDFIGDASVCRHLSDYYTYSVEADRLMNESSNEEWEEFMTKNEDQFQDLIASDDWYLLDETQEKADLLIPRFCQNNEIVWRWNTR